MSPFLEIVQKERVLQVSLNRPDKRNALTAALCRDLAATIEIAGLNPDVGAILLTGNGKSFCAGMDLSEIPPENSEEINQAHEHLFTIGAHLTKPLVAAVHGAALGGGTGLVANCHIVIAAEDATFGLTEIRLGLWPFLVYRAVESALGNRRTLEWALTGRIVGAAAAREAGLVHEIAADPREAAWKTAAAIAASSPSAIHAGMSFVHETRDQDWKSAREIAHRYREETFETPDFQEGIRAFHEKRAPKWPSLE